MLICLPFFFVQCSARHTSLHTPAPPHARMLCRGCCAATAYSCGMARTWTRPTPTPSGCAPCAVTSATALSTAPSAVGRPPARCTATPSLRVSQEAGVQGGWSGACAVAGQQALKSSTGHSVAGTHCSRPMPASSSLALPDPLHCRLPALSPAGASSSLVVYTMAKVLNSDAAACWRPPFLLFVQATPPWHTTWCSTT